MYTLIIAKHECTRILKIRSPDECWHDVEKVILVEFSIICYLFMTKPPKWHVCPAKTDQPGHPPSLIRVFAIRMKKAWVLSYPLSAQRRLWSDWADPQADLSFCWAHILLVLSCDALKFNIPVNTITVISRHCLHIGGIRQPCCRKSLYFCVFFILLFCDLQLTCGGPNSRDAWHITCT